MPTIRIVSLKAAPIQVRSLKEIAKDIKSHWPKVHFSAKPYLDAMAELDKITDSYGADDGKSIVLYFLSNASVWRGPDARRLKTELNSMLRG